MERCLCDDYEVRGIEYGLWIDGSRNGDYPNWWLTDGHKPGWVVTEDDFEPKLTDKEINAISEYVLARVTDA